MARNIALLIAASLLGLTPLPSHAQHGGMGGGGGGGMPSGGSMPGTGSGNFGGMGGMSGTGRMSGPQDARRMHAEALRKAHRELFDVDPHDNLIIRNEVIGIGTTTRGLEAAQDAGFVVRRRDHFAGLHIDLGVLVAPQGMSARRALKKLREIDPGVTYDFNHVYFAGSVTGAEIVVQAAQTQVQSSQGGGRGPARRVGLVDGGVDVSHAALRSVRPHVHGCNGVAIASSHGTAVASRLVAGFNLDAPASSDVELYVADVYCGEPTGGSADLVVDALAWLIDEGVPVINISLVGPPNALLQRVVESASARGHLLVAAVGNDGPAAPPLYPAAYPGVVAVTAVDHADKVLTEAGRGRFIAFAAPGADVEAASLPTGFASVRGTSYAAPIVASQLALRLDRPDAVAAQRAIDTLTAVAVDLGSPGRDPVYGNGCIGCGSRATKVSAHTH